MPTFQQLILRHEQSQEFEADPHRLSEAGTTAPVVLPESVRRDQARRAALLDEEAYFNDDDDEELDGPPSAPSERPLSPPSPPPPPRSPAAGAPSETPAASFGLKNLLSYEEGANGEEAESGRVLKKARREED